MPAQQQRLLDRLFKIPVRGLDAAVFVADAAVVARAAQAVVIEQRRVAHGEVLLFGQVLERGRQAVGAVLPRCTTGLPQRVLQPPGQSLEALAAFDHRDILPAREGEHEVVQDVDEQRASDRDAQLAHGSEVSQALPARRMVLREEHLPVRTLQRTPLPNVALQGKR